MHPNDLLARVQARPFVPFRLVVSEGATYEVRHPDMIIVARRSVVVGVPSPHNEGIADTTHLIALIHVVRIEPLEPAQAQ
jgi:hypothetical protein